MDQMHLPSSKGPDQPWPLRQHVTAELVREKAPGLVSSEDPLCSLHEQVLHSHQ
jgi:hypothetical protein